MKTYSQNREQDVILEYFGLSAYTFLSIGENDGETLSNVRALANLGWRGVCVEPDPVAFKKLFELYRTRTDVFCYPYAISDKTGTATFYSSGTHLKSGDTGLLSTLKKGELKRWKEEKFEEVEVETKTWDDFNKIIPYSEYDFISIDAEGMDYQILKQMDLEVMNTKMVCIEWNGVKETRELVEKKLGKNWCIKHLNGENLIYVRQ